MIINTELGTFGDNGELDDLRTKWDKSLDAERHDRGAETFNKMISLKYLGEIVRRVLVDLKDQNLIFQSQSLKELSKPYSFDSDALCMVESDPVGVYDKARIVLGKLGLKNVSNEDCREVRHVCEYVSTRAAYLMSACCTAMLRKVDERDVAIVVTGDLFHVHPYFRTELKMKIRKLMGIDTNIDLFEQSTGIGAVFLAADLR